MKLTVKEITTKIVNYKTGKCYDRNMYTVGIRSCLCRLEGPGGLPGRGSV